MERQGSSEPKLDLYEYPALWGIHLHLANYPALHLANYPALYGRSKNQSSKNISSRGLTILTEVLGEALGRVYSEGGIVLPMGRLAKAIRSIPRRELRREGGVIGEGKGVDVEGTEGG